MAGVFELYQRDCVGKISPGLLPLVHNLDPDVVVLSMGSLDLTEGVQAKDIFCALKILAEQALAVPRKKPEFGGSGDGPWFSQEKYGAVAAEAVDDVGGQSSGGKTTAATVDAYRRDHFQSKFPRKIILVCPPSTPSTRAYPDMEYRRTQMQERIKFQCAVDPAMDFVEPEPVSGAAFQHPSYPLTTAEYLGRKWAIIQKRF